MRIPCPTCHRKGRVPIIHDGPMCYSGRNGENWPHETCQTCMGSGWVNDATPIKTDAQVQIDGLTAQRNQRHETR